MMNAYDFIKQSRLFAAWDGVSKPPRPLIQLAYDLLHYGYISPKPDTATRNELSEMLYFMKNGDD